jgi:hypothetical protein
VLARLQFPGGMLSQAGRTGCWQTGGAGRSWCWQIVVLADRGAGRVAAQASARHGQEHRLPQDASELLGTRGCEPVGGIIRPNFAVLRCLWPLQLI